MNYKIKDQEIGIFSMARTSSRRCKRKMIRKFDNTTLTDIVLSNLSKLGKNTFNINQTTLGLGLAIHLLLPALLYLPSSFYHSKN